MAQPVDGFYLAFVTGAAGQGLVLFVLREGVICGADAMGVTYDGTCTVADEGMTLEGVLRVRVPEGIPMVQGGLSQGEKYELPLRLSLDPAVPFTRVEMPRGPVNVRLQKIRDLE